MKRINVLSNTILNGLVKNIFKKIVFLLVTIFCLNAKSILAQEKITIQTQQIDGIELTQDNVFKYQIMNHLDYEVNADVVGQVKYRNTNYLIKYSFPIKLQSGLNQLDKNQLTINWNYSSSALKELFTLYNTVPTGMYEYCITITPKFVIGEYELPNSVQECMFYKKQELFLINLITPENDAKIYEFNPTFNWVANYSFSNELTYKIKVAEIKKGQNTENAIVRNNPIYQEGGLYQNALIYPVSAKPLETFQPYAWTVDAYYKGILLGSAEPWKFTIVEDSANEIIPKDISFIEVNIENGTNTSLIAGQIKLKFIEKEHRNNLLDIKLLNADNKEMKGFSKKWDVSMGENRIAYQLADLEILKHKKIYFLSVSDSDNNQYLIRFKYFNPEFIK